MDQLDKPVLAEWNPHRPDIPEDVESLSPRLYDFLRDQAEALRKQHNLTQAGDTSFPWDIITLISQQAQFTLGSLGRFYHPIYGLITARYVQFTNMNPAIWSGAPVGLDTSFFDFGWRATNQFAKSRSDLVMGVCGAYETPESNQYGWVIVHGVAIQRLDFAGPLNRFERFSWTGDGIVARTDDTTGPPVGLVFGTQIAGAEMEAGTPFIDALSLSVAAELGLADVEAEIASIKKAVTDLEYSLTIKLAHDINEAEIDYGLVLHGLSVVNQRVASISFDRVTATLDETIQLMTNYRIGAATDATNAREAAIQTQVAMTATNQFRRTAEIASSDALQYSISATEMRNDATLMRNEATLQAQASATFAQEALTYRDEAGDHAEATQELAVRVQLSIGSFGNGEYHSYHWKAGTGKIPIIDYGLSPNHTIVNVAGVGNVLHVESDQAVIEGMGFEELLPDHSYEVQARFRQLAAPVAINTYIGFTLYDSNLVALSHVYGHVLNPGVSANWTVGGATFTYDDFKAMNPAIAFISPFMFLGYREAPIIGDIHELHYLSLRDVTEREDAADFADAAATSASTAGTHATDAGLSATAASNSATTASVHAGNASSSATTATNQASLATTEAANAQASAILSATAGRDSLILNPVFADWPNPAAMPADWVAYVKGGNRVAGFYGGYAFQQDCSANDAGGLFTAYTPVGSYPNGLYVMEVEFTLDVGTLAGMGVILRAADAGLTTSGDFNATFPTMKDINGIERGMGFVGQTYRYRFIYNNTFLNSSRLQAYFMTNGYFGAAPKTVTLRRFAVRPATRAEALVMVLSAANVDTVTDKANAVFEVVTTTGGATAAVRIKSETAPGVMTSNVALEAAEIQFWNNAAGIRQLAAKIIGGVSTFFGDIEVGGAIHIGDRRINIALQSFQVLAGDGEVISFGTDLIRVPKLLFDTTGLAPKAATDVYDVKATSLTSTGFTMYAKIVTPGTTAVVNTGAGTDLGAGVVPRWRVHKGDAADAYNGIYNFSTSMSATIISGNGDPNYAIFEVEYYARPTGGAWTLIGTGYQQKNGGVPGGTALTTIVDAVYFGTAIGLDATEHEFAVLAVQGVVTAFNGVSYTKQSTSGTTSATPSGQKVVVTVIPQNV